MFWIAIATLALAMSFAQLGAYSVTVSLLSVAVKVLLALIVSGGGMIAWQRVRS